MFNKSFAALLAAPLLALSAGIAQAHTGIGDTTGLANGFLHPIGGLDHILAMVAVGLFAAQLGGRATWLVPASFVALMALGGALGATNVAIPSVELGIGLSVVVFGAAVAFGLPVALPAAMALAGFFAMFHGHAHGAEMPAGAGGLSYGLGFLLGTAVLLAAGVGFYRLVGGRRRVEWPIRVAGSVVAVTGVALLGALI